MFKIENYGSLVGVVLMFAAIAEIKAVREHNVIHGAVEGLVFWGFIQYIKWNNARQNTNSRGISGEGSQGPVEKI